MVDWHMTPPTNLENTIAEFKSALPGWWYSVGECQVSCDASCGPTVESEHIALISGAGDPFDEGFHADLPQPSTMAIALATVMQAALLEIGARGSNEAKANPTETMASHRSTTNAATANATGKTANAAP